MSRDDATILDVLCAAKFAVQFVDSMDRQSFNEDVKTQSAVLHQLLLIGEGVKRFSDSFRQSHSEIPWKQIAGMRDILIHQYDRVDLDEVWKTVQTDIPDLISFLTRIEPSRDSQKQ